VGGDIFIDSETLLMTDFVNLNIKSVQSFGYTYRSSVYGRVFVALSSRTCISNLCLYCVLKKRNPFQPSHLLPGSFPLPPKPGFAFRDRTVVVRITLLACIERI
jgi:hypothetical protein